jgi:hypothetical protein
MHKRPGLSQIIEPPCDATLQRRRQALARLGAFAAAPLAACSSIDPTGASADTVEAAFEYAFPLFEMARTRYNALDNPANPLRGRVNTLAHRRALSDHTSRAVTTPNNDTLYSSAWLDLSATPVRVSVAQMPAGRYWSVALMDAFSNNAAMLGTRLDGRGPVEATLVGPRWRGALPDGSTARVIRLPGDDVWLLARWLVDGPQDLPAAHAMQDGLRLTPLVATAANNLIERVPPRSSLDPENFLAVVNQMLARNPAPAADSQLLWRYSAAGLRPGALNLWPTLSISVQQLWRERIGAMHANLRAGAARGAREVQGWRLAAATLGNFGSDHALRAATALGGLAALEPVEAVYFSRELDAAGQPLDGQHRYRIRVPAAGVPSDSFWSLSVYERLPDGRLFFTDNPIQRYAIGDRTPGLRKNGDGSLDLWLQRVAPSGIDTAPNWLPAPAGPLQLTLRAYLPKPELREGRALLPSIERLG